MDGTTVRAAQDDEHRRDEAGEEEDEEGSGISLMGNETGDDDSSEEEDDDSEEERAIREGFIVDEDEDAQERRRRHRRHKRKHRKHRRRERDEGGAAADDDDADSSRKRRRAGSDAESDLDEEDLALLEENTGVRRSRPESKKLKRLRRRRASADPEEESARPTRDGLAGIFDDDEDDVDAAYQRGAFPFGADEMAGFIEEDDDEDEEGIEDLDEEEREARRTLRRKERAREDKRNRMLGSKGGKRTGGGSGGGVFGTGAMAGIDNETWQEVIDVFGRGDEYEWAMDADDEKQTKKKELQDIFEPSEIQSRFLTAADDLIRVIDMPERLQLAITGMPPPALTDEGPGPLLETAQHLAAARWMAHRISRRCTEEFFVGKDGQLPDPELRHAFLAAVERVIAFLTLNYYEAPFIYHHRSDYLVHSTPAQDDGTPSQETLLLDQEELHHIADMTIQYRALVLRRHELEKYWDELEVTESGDAKAKYFNDVLPECQSLEELADLRTWVEMHFVDQTRALNERKEAESAGADRHKLKRVNRTGRYEALKPTAIGKQFAPKISIPSFELARSVVMNVNTDAVVLDEDMDPDAFADLYVTDEVRSADVALESAKFVCMQEIGHDPMIRRLVRQAFRDKAVVSVRPTELGKAKINQYHPYFEFKYLDDKPLSRLFFRSDQFLRILAAAADSLVTFSITLPRDARQELLDKLKDAYTNNGGIATEWNEVRVGILDRALREVLEPMAADWTATTLRTEQEDFVGQLCYQSLRRRADIAPYCRQDGTMDFGDTPTVLAVTHGKGDPKRDSVIAVFFDDQGNLREHAKIDNLKDEEPRKQMYDLLRRRRPQVIALGGFGPSAKTRLQPELLEIAAEVSKQVYEDNVDQQDDEDYLDDMVRQARATFDIFFVHDDVARVYMTGKRSETEFPDLEPYGRYCVGLARYMQSPLNEFAALGGDLTAISFHPSQRLISKDRALKSLERAMVDIVNKTGITINRAVHDPYYSTMLPYISGLGPRKASSIIKAVNGASVGGTLLSRQQLVMDQIMTANVWVNVSGFFRISSDDSDDLAANRDDEDEGARDILDSTRIHPELYNLARKMAADALDMDEEDIDENAPSSVVKRLMEEGPEKLDELALDEFAAELQHQSNGDERRRLALYLIRDEIKQPWRELRGNFRPPSPDELFFMLSGETPQTLQQGFIIPVHTTGASKDIVFVRLDSGIQGEISLDRRGDLETNNPGSRDLPKPGPGVKLQAYVLEIDPILFSVQLSTQVDLLQIGDAPRRQVQRDEFWDFDDMEKDRRAAEASKSSARGGRYRNINHPNFHNFDGARAEEYLAQAAPGDCVIRPSSKEDHLAVTWKIDDDVYQHIAVHELDKADEFSLGRKLRIGNGKYTYEDLDQVIADHVRGLAKKVSDLKAHEKYRGTKAELESHLNNFTAANPGSSAYAFCLDAGQEEGGQFKLGFKTSLNAKIQYWSVRVEPRAYVLAGHIHPTVADLCNGFKKLYAETTINAPVPVNRVKTPHGMRGGATPGYGGRTPNPAMAMGGGRTPNPPMGMGGGRTPGMGGGRTPAMAMAAGPGGGGRTPGGDIMGMGRMTPQGAPMAGGRTPMYGGQGMQPQGMPGRPGAGGGLTPFGGPPGAGGTTPFQGGGRTPHNDPRLGGYTPHGTRLGGATPYGAR